MNKKSYYHEYDERCKVRYTNQSELLDCKILRLNSLDAIVRSIMPY